MIIARYNKNASLLELSSPELTGKFIREKLTGFSLYTFTPYDYEDKDVKERGVATIPCYSPEHASGLIEKLRSRGLDVSII